MTAAILYGINPVARNAIANGRLGPLVLFALAPFIVLAVRARGGLRRHHRSRGAASRAHARRLACSHRDRGGVLPARRAVPRARRAGAFARRLDPARGATSWRRCAAIARGRRRRSSPAACCCSRGPRTVADFRTDPAAFGFAFRFPDSSLDRGVAVPHRPVGCRVRELGPLRGRAASRSWSRAARGSAWVAPGVVPRRRRDRGGVRAVAAVAERLGAGARRARSSPPRSGWRSRPGSAIGAFGDELRRARFGWRQLAARARGRRRRARGRLGFAADSVDGRWHAATRGLGRERCRSPRSRPSGPVPHPLDRRPGGAADRPVRGARRRRLRAHRRRCRRRARAAARADARTPTPSSKRRRVARARRSHEPARAGSSRRWACATSRRRRATGPAARAARRSRGCDARLADQLDLAQLGVESGLVLYENTAWFPGVGVAADGRRGPTGVARRSRPPCAPISRVR